MARTNEGDFDVAVAAVRFITELGLLTEFHRHFNRLLAPDYQRQEQP